VATRIATHTQVLDDAVAFLVPPTASGLAQGIREVLAHPEEARERAEKALALLKKDFGPERYREKVRNAYEFVASGTGQPS
jgi:glycosyltransferase involved in cell wall biosynthesis